MKIQLKRSNVLSSGAAKTPTATQLEYGELAVNYNNTDPAIFLKDSNNNVIRISGVGNISDDGLTNVPDGTSPPSNPEVGNLWYNSDQGRLYIYFQDADTSQWVDASPDSWDPSSYPDVTNSSAQSNTLDDRYAMVNGGNSFTGNLTIPDKIIHSADTNTAIRFPANDTVSVETAGNERLRIDSSGNVGIGTSSPNAYTNYKTLTLDGTSGGAIDFETSGTKIGTVYSSSSLFYIQAAASKSLVLSSNDTERLRIDSSGNIGIGTSSPSQILELKTAEPRVCLNATNAAAELGIEFEANGSRQGHIFHNHTSGELSLSCGENTAGSHFMTFNTGNGAEAMRIDSSGTLVIGRTTSSDPNRYVQIHNGSAASSAYFQSTNTGTGSGAADGIVMGMGDATNAYFWNYEAGSLVFATSATERMRINVSGNIGIGTTSPSGLLSIHEATSSTSNYINITNNATGVSSWANGMLVGVDATGEALCWQNENNILKFGTNNAERMRIYSDGGVSFKQYLEFANQAGNGFAGYIGSAGVIAAGGSGNDLAVRSGQHLVFTAGGSTEKMRITTSGDVGIGVTSPSFKLEVNSGSIGTNIYAQSSVASVYLRFANSANTLGYVGYESDQLSFYANNQRNYQLKADGTHIWSYGAAERMRVLPTGGLTFNGDTAQANALDDYEEGSCIITMFITGTSTVVASANTVAYYTKIGNVVNVSFYSGPMYPTVAGGAEIDGLPFSNLNGNNHYPVAVFSHSTAFATDIQNGYMSTNSNNLYPMQRNSTYGAQWNTSGGAKYVMFTITYQTN